MIGRKKRLTPFRLFKKIRRIRRTAKAVKTGFFFYNRILPWLLVAFAAVAYAVFNVPVPEKKEPKKYKETWR